MILYYEIHSFTRHNSAAFAISIIYITIMTNFRTFRHPKSNSLVFTPHLPPLQPLPTTVLIYFCLYGFLDTPCK